MSRALKLSLAILFAILADSAALQAQMNGGSSSSGGMFNNRTMNTSTNSSGIGIGSSSSGGGAFGQNGGPVQQSQQAVGGQASSLTSNNGFIGANTQQGTNGNNFVGAAQASAAQQGSMGGMGGIGGMGGMGMSGMGGMGSMGGMSMGGGGMGGYGQNGRPGQIGMGGMQQNNPMSQIRTQIAIAFPTASVVPSQVSTALGRDLASLPALHWDSAPKVEVQGRTVVLRGTVATEHDRDLAERVARLEPTVSQVVNQLVVATPAAAGSAGSNSAPAGSVAPGLQPATGSSRFAPAILPPLVQPAEH